MHRVRPALWRLVLDGAGWLLVGFAVGVMAYFPVSDGLTALDQWRMRGQVAGLLAVSDPASAVEGPVRDRLDFEGWGTQDLPYWEGLELGGVFGRIVIPRIGLDSIVVRGTERPQLAKGPGWIVWTDLPGPTGNCGISGHRTTYGHPFGDLDRLVPGDTIDLYSPYRRYRYTVESTSSVTPDHSEVVAHTEEPRLTLTTCHPPFSARYRLVVSARLTAVERSEQPTQAPRP